MAFPSEAVPDGHVAAPHHVYLGVLVLLVVVFVVADDYRHREPLLALVGGLTTLFGFGLVWPHFPVTGASLALGGLALALTGVVWPGGVWTSYSVGARAVALLGVLVAFDDVLEHALGVTTPLDWLWVRYLYPVLP